MLILDSSGPLSPRAGIARGALIGLGAALVAVVGFIALRHLQSEEPVVDPNRGIIAPTAQVEAEPEPDLEPTELVTPAKPEIETEPEKDMLVTTFDIIQDALPEGRGSITGRLIDGQTGRPITSPITVRMSPNREPTDASHWARFSTSRFLTPRNGEFRLGGHPEGRYYLNFEVDGYNSKVTRIDVPLEAPITVQMERGLWIHGTVTDAFGNLVKEMEVSLLPQESGDAFVQTARTDSNGKYLFRNLDAGNWQVELTGLSGMDEIPSSQTMTISEATPEGVWDVVLPALTIVKLNVEFDRMVMKDPVATLASRKGARITTRVRGSSAYFAAVPPGYYDLTIGNDGNEPWHYEWIEVPESDEPIVLDRKVKLPKREPVAARSNAKTAGGTREYRKLRAKNQRKAKKGKDAEAPDDGR